MRSSGISSILIAGVVLAASVFAFAQDAAAGFSHGERGRDADPAAAAPTSESGDPGSPGSTGAPSGDLLVTTFPDGAVVKINQRVFGVTPLKPLSVDPGWHLVQASKSELFGSARVRVNAGELTTVALTLGGGRGELSVSSDPPGAVVALDGEDRGTTPLDLEDIPAGEHDVAVRSEGFVDYRAAIEIRAGEESRLDARLQVPASLEVRSEPEGARIYLRDRPADRTPAVLHSVRPGRVGITLKMENYEEWTDAVELGEGESKTLTAELVPRRRSIQLISDPAGAEIEMDGQVIGNTPLAWAVPMGERQFVFRLAGYEDYRLKLEVSEDTASNLEVTLSRLRGSITLSHAPPGATVTVDGPEAGVWKAPVRSRPVPVGQRTFRLSAPGYRTVDLRVVVSSGQEVLLEPQWTPKSGTGGVHRVLVPGWSQHYQEKRVRSLLLPTAQLASLVGLLVATNAYNEAVDEYETAWKHYLNQVSPEAIDSAWRVADDRHTRLDEKKTIRTVFLGASVGVYLYSLVDATLLAPRGTPPDRSAALGIETDPSSGRITLNLRLPF